MNAGSSPAASTGATWCPVFPPSLAQVVPTFRAHSSGEELSVLNPMRVAGSSPAGSTMKMIVARRDGGVAIAAYVFLPNHPETEGCVVETVPVGHGVGLDLDAEGKLIGVEILMPVELRVVPNTTPNESR